VSALIAAREEVCNCFFLAQKDAFAAAGVSLGKQQSDVELRAMIRETVKGAFRRAGANWEAPTRSDLERVVQDLGTKALAFGTPMEIISRHQATLLAVLRDLPGT
jgi:hypothetical protein